MTSKDKNHKPLEEESKKDTKSNQKQSTGAASSLKQYIKKKIEQKIMQVIRNQKPKIKKAIKDKNMPMCVQNFTDSLVDENFPIIEEEIQYQIRMKTDIPFVEAEKPDVSIFCWLCWKFRSVTNYTSQPYDKSLGQKMGNLLWWIFTLASLCPYYGVSSFYFIFMFLMMDKSDEYQLINFVFQFKKFMFLGTGFLGGIVGFYLFFQCVDRDTNPDITVLENCNTYGPGLLIHPLIDLIAYGLNILLVWITLVFLPFSEQKGKLRFRIAEDEEQKEQESKQKKAQKILVKIEKKIDQLALEGKVMTVKDLASEYGLDEYDDAYKDKGCLSCCTCFNCSRGGGVRCLVIWDMISFGLATLFFYGSYKLESENFLEAKGHIYFTKWIYGCLSFPFLCFSLPILNGLLSRARPTAYDQYGNTVPITGQIDYDDDDDLMDDIDVQQELDNIEQQQQKKK